MIDVVIIGAGASGLTTAIVAARSGKKVLLLEKNSKVGKKLLATGNGKCNITNQRPTIERFHSHNPKFITQLLEGYGYQQIKQFFKSIGLELIEGKEGKVFPMSLQALSVVELLACECEQLGVKTVCNTKVEKIVKERKSYRIYHSQGSVVANHVVIATGHRSAPQLGGVMDGIGFAQHFGHSIVDDFPTLVQLTSPRKDLKEMAGVKIESRVTFKQGKERIVKQGDVLFTTYGISGLAILDISRFVIQALKSRDSVALEVDLMPKMSAEQLMALMRKSVRKKSQKSLEVWLQGFINKKLISVILAPLKYSSLKESQITMEHIEKIVQEIKSFAFVVNGSRGYKGAEVAIGGVNTCEVNAETLESKKSKGLYLVGEVLDVDGDRGGFNLHFAWVCGLRAGQNL